MSGTAHEIDFLFPSPRAFRRDIREQERHKMLTAELLAALAREQAWTRNGRDLLQRQAILAQEFEHRLINGLHLIASLLSLQSQTATPEAAAQLTTAARRVMALGRVHRQLHLLDHERKVEFSRYLRNLCEDLSGLLFEQSTGHVITVEGASVEIPTTFAIPLGFIVNELTTNAAKYAKGNIIVRLETSSPRDYSLSVLDNGAGLPAGFKPGHSKGLGMKIVQALVKQIGGALHIGHGDNGRGARFTVSFSSPRFLA